MLAVVLLAAGLGLRTVSPLCEEEGVQVILLRGCWGTPAQGSMQEGRPCQGRGGQHVCVC